MDLSILIPSRNEEFLGKTIEDILSNIEGDTEVIAVLDGYEDNALPVDPRVKIVKLPSSIGQRAATNLACKLSNAKYVMKVDAHCAFDRGFDVKMMNEMQDDWTMLPIMRNLHVFDWVCSEGHRRYQSPSGVCTVCGKETVKDVVWIAKSSPQSTAYRFDTDMHFQYWNEWGQRQKGDLTETMSIQGSCFMVTRQKYWELDICSEEFNSWGQQGTEVACKTWLSGGKVIVNRKTWYAHMFRTQGGDFSFPYENPQSKVIENREKTKDLFRDNKWTKRIHDFQWLIDKFNPPGWSKKGILFYTDNQLSLKIAHKVQKQLLKSGIPITSVSLKPMTFGKNICLPLERGYLTMAKQIVAGLEAMDSEIVFMCEHDVLYPAEHFDFTPTKRDVYYYNTNSWWLRSEDGHGLYFNHRAQSGLCGFRETLLKHYKERLKRIEDLIKTEKDGMVTATSGNLIPLKEGIHRLGFEPGTHNRPEKIDELTCEDFRTEKPLVDIRHDNNLTQNRWSIDKFRSKPKEWIETEDYSIPGWNKEEICQA